MAIKHQKVISRTPENVDIDFDSLPVHEQDRICRIMLQKMREFFDDPKNAAEYAAWQQLQQGGNV
jgi:hypothetical protein